jgi:O-acetylhomoserine/O-acetylserine sulfhydrylase-like pyridoxal-dependent enzyme
MGTRRQHIDTVLLHGGRVPDPASGVTRDFIWLSIGIENISGIPADIGRALDKAA